VEFPVIFLGVDIVDAQVHLWDRGSSAPASPGTLPEVTAEVTLSVLDAAGVSGAVVVSPWERYRFDPAYALASAARHPVRFRVVVPVDAGREDVSEVVAAWRAEPLVVGLRLMLRQAMAVAESDLRESRLFAAAQAARLPLCVSAKGYLGEVASMARRFPELQVVVDHLGLLPLTPGRNGAAALADLPDLLKLAACPNVAVKLSGLPALSSGRYPFDDLRPLVHQVLEGFGSDRVMWGSDWTQMTGFASYEEGLRFLAANTALSSPDLERLLATSAREIFSWPAGRPGPRLAGASQETR
jgi:L-fuconolactonase